MGSVVMVHKCKLLAEVWLGIRTCIPLPLIGIYTMRTCIKMRRDMRKLW